MNILKKIIAFLFSLAGGGLYRKGGTSAGTLWRDLGVPICMVIIMTLLGKFHWSLILCFGLMYASCTTYFKKKGEPVRFYNWIIVGLAFSLSMLPYTFFVHDWIGFGLRTITCTLGITLWSSLIGWDVLEEWGRGFIVLATLFFL